MPNSHTSIAATLAPARTLELVRAERVPPVFALPDIPELHRSSRRIDSDDESEIRYFLRNWRVSDIAASSGSFGNQLEQAEAFGFGALPCRRCGGKWRARRLPKDRQCPDCRTSLPAGTYACPGCRRAFISSWQDGTGQAPRNRFGKRISYATALAEYRCKMQRELGIVLSSKPVPKPELGVDAEQIWRASVEAFAAQGKRLMTDADLRELFPRLPENECEQCKECGGIGVTPRRAPTHGEITAWPTGSSKQLGGAESDDAAAMTRKLSEGRTAVSDGKACVHLAELERYLGMQTLLADVGRTAMIARVAIEEYYIGDNGMAALEVVCGIVGFGDKPSAARTRAANELRDFSCQVFNLCAYGAQ